MIVLIKDNEITFLVRGNIRYIRGLSYVDTVKSIKKFFPESPIIFSTWEGEEVKLREGIDEVIFNKDPGQNISLYKKMNVTNNGNRQITAAINGLNKVKTPYTLLMRSDFFLYGRGFLNYFNQYDVFEDKYKILNKRVICRNDSAKKIPFWLPDLFSFGLTKDIVNLWNIPLAKPYSASYPVEIFLFVSFLRKNGFKVELKEENYQENLDLSRKIILNNFMLLDYPFWNLKSFDLRLNVIPSNKMYFYDWLKLYERRFGRKVEKKVKYIAYKYWSIIFFIFRKLIARLISFFIPKKAWRKKIRSLIIFYRKM